MTCADGRRLTRRGEYLERDAASLPMITIPGDPPELVDPRDCPVLPEQRLAWLHDTLGWTHDSLAGLLGISVATVKRRVRMGRSLAGHDAPTVGDLADWRETYGRNGTSTTLDSRTPQEWIRDLGEDAAL